MATPATPATPAAEYSARMHRKCKRVPQKSPRKVPFTSKSIARKLATVTQECRPVGAWVEVCSEEDSFRAVQSAAQIESEIENTVRQKEEKLRQFQQSVQRRVRDKEYEKRVSQHAYSAENAERLKSTDASGQAVKKSILRRSDKLNIVPGCPGYNLRAGMKSVQLTTHAEKVHDYTIHAKQNLLRRKTEKAGEENEDPLPGGNWKPVRKPDLDDDTSEDTDHAPEEPAVNVQTKSARKRVDSARRTGLMVEIYPGVVEREVRKQCQTQRALYRRLYSDIEREKVKETRRHQEEQKKIEKIKGRAECQRYDQECRLRVVVTPEPMNPSPPKKIEESRCERLENERYIHELKITLKQKMLMADAMGTPPLCNCGSDFWDTDPETCANNCEFYNNREAYVKALKTVLATF